jgi:dTDP-4-dehydrorhamnose reductase
MKVVLTGASGLLGKYLLDSAPDMYSIYATSKSAFSYSGNQNLTYTQLDLLDTKSLYNYLSETKPDAIIHSAAEGSVDKIQNNLNFYYPLNVTLALNLAKYCQEKSIKFIFISSNSVFGGSETTYSDNSNSSPINDYGTLKVEAEKLVREVNSGALIIRPILMYGWPYPNRRANPVTTWISNLRSSKSFCVVNDVFTEPLAAWDCAKAIWKGLEIDAEGIVNVSGGGLTSLYDFAILTSEVFCLDSNLISPVPSSYFPEIAPRPKKISYDLMRLKNEFGITPSIPIDGLGTLKQIEKV